MVLSTCSIYFSYDYVHFSIVNTFVKIGHVYSCHDHTPFSILGRWVYTFLLWHTYLSILLSSILKSTPWLHPFLDFLLYITGGLWIPSLTKPISWLSILSLKVGMSIRSMTRPFQWVDIFINYIVLQ